MNVRRAIVADGRGRATRQLNPLSDRLASVLGAPVRPGTLNLVLDRPALLDPHEAIPLDQWGKRSVWTAELEGRPVLLHRWRGCPLHIVEVVSDQPLRLMLGLETGGSVSIEMPLSPLSSSRRIVWSLLWAGRRNRFYSDDRYVRSVRRLDRRGLSSQP